MRGDHNGSAVRGVQVINVAVALFGLMSLAAATSACPAVVVNETDAPIDADQPIPCQTDNDCIATDTCRVGTCNLASNTCDFTTAPDACFVDGLCYNADQPLPGDGCMVCDPSLSNDALVNKQCPSDTTCDSQTGLCLGADVIADTGVDADPELPADVPPDLPADLIEDLPQDVVAEADVAGDAFPDVSPDADALSDADSDLSSDVPSDADPADATTDTSDTADDAAAETVSDVPPTAPPPATFAPTGGGGRGASENYRIRVLLAPHRVGRGTTGSHQIRIGVGEVQHTP